MTRFLITALGSYGDVHPMVGLGNALCQRGQRAQIVTNPYFEEVVAAAGCEFIPIGTREEYLRLTKHPHLWHPALGPRLVLDYGMVGLLRPLYDILSKQLDSNTVLVAHGLDLASRVLGEQHGLPVASADFAPQAFWSEYKSPRVPGALVGDWVPRWLKRLQLAIAEKCVLDPLVGRPLNRLRREMGLRPVRRTFSTWWHDTPLVLGMFPDWFAPPQPDWPAATVLAGFPLWDGGRDEELDEEVRDFLEAGDPPIVFAPGSANRAAAEFFATAVDVCGRLDRRGVLLTRFREQLPSVLPPGMRHFDFVPFSRLLPRAAAFVHHGGIGSCAQGLAAGVPQLVRPLAFDQFDNTRRLVRLGVAEELSARRFGGGAVAAVERLCASSGVRSRCRELAARCNGPAALGRACDALERLAETWPVRYKQI